MACNLNSFFIPFCRKDSDTSNSTDRFIQTVKDLKNTYSDEDITDGIRSLFRLPIIRKSLKSNDPSLYTFITDNDYHNISNILNPDKGTENIPVPVTLKTDDLLEPGKERKDTILDNRVIEDAFRGNVGAQQRYLDNMNRDLNFAVSVNPSTMKRITSEEEMNASVRSYQQSLLDSICSWLKDTGKTGLYNAVTSLGKIYDPGDVTTRMTQVLDLFDRYFGNKDNFGPSDVRSYGMQDSGSRKAGAFADYLTLRYPDIIMRNIFGKTVHIADKYKNIYTDTDKYVFQNGTAGSTSWIDEDKMFDEDKMVDKRVINTVGSFPMWKKDSSGVYAKTGRFITYKEAEAMVMNFQTIANDHNTKGTILHAGDNNVEDFRSLMSSVFGKEKADDIIRNDIDGKSMSDIINGIYKDPFYMSAASIWFLKNDIGLQELLSYAHSGKKGPGMTQNDMDVLESIYHGMFDPDNQTSLFNLDTDNHSTDGTKTKYNMMINVLAQLFQTEKNEMHGYDMQQGQIVRYANKRANSRINNLQSEINSRFYPGKDVYMRGIDILDNFNTSSCPSDNTVTVKFGKYSIVSRNSPNSNERVTLELDGVPVNIHSLDETNADNTYLALCPVFDNVIAGGFSDIKNGRSELFENLVQLDGNRSLALSDLVKTTGNILYNYRVSRFLNGNGTTDFVNKLNNFYPNAGYGQLVKYVQYNQVNTTYRCFGQINNISKALDMYNGIVDQIMISDSAGKQMSAATNSSISTKTGMMMDEKKNDYQSVMRGLHYDRTYAGKTFVRDGKSPSGDVTKATKFNGRELMYSYLLFDYYGSRAITGGRQSADDHATVAVIPGVYSDKTKLARALSFINVPIDDNGTTIGSVLTSKDGIDVIRDHIRTDLGSIYVGQLNNIRTTWDRLNIELAKEGLPAFDVLDDYAGVNAWIKDYSDRKNASTGLSVDWSSEAKKKIQDTIHEIIYKAQTDPSQTDIRFNDALLWKWDKDNTVHGNPLLFNELYHTGIIDDMPEKDRIASAYGDYGFLDKDTFYNMKTTQLVSDMIQDLGTDGFRLKTGSKPMVSDAAVFMRQMMKGWMGKDDRVVLARIHTIGSDGKRKSSKNISSEINLYKDNWKVYGDILDNEDWIRENIPETDADGLLVDNSKFSLGNIVRFLNDGGYEKLKRHLLDERTKDSILGTVYRNASEEAASMDPETVRKSVNTSCRKQVLDTLSDNPNAYDNLMRKNGLTDQKGLLDYLMGTYKDASDAAYTRRWAQYKKEGIQRKLEAYGDHKSLLYWYSRNKKLLGDTARIDKSFDNYDKYEPQKYELEVNPELAKFNAFDYLMGEQDLISSVGTVVNHSFKFSRNGNIQEMAALANGQRIKRNVSNTSTKIQELRNTIAGVPQQINVATCKDLEHVVFNPYGEGISGTPGNRVYNAKSTVTDGATCENPLFRIEELASLGTGGAGTDGKTIYNDLDAKSGTGLLIKTAVFVLTNARIRSSRAYQTMIWHMNNLPWYSIQDIFHNYDGKPIDYDPVYYFKDGQYYRRDLIAQDGNGIVSYNDTPVSPEGDNMGESVQKATKRPLSSNYDLWNLFGGAWSASMKGNILKYADDDTSWKNTALAIDSIGTKRYDKVNSADDVIRPLRGRKIDLWPFLGAVKQGAANVNDSSAVNDPSYHVTYMNMSPIDAGQQLNPEHKADSSTISPLTQVFNALSARGYSVRDTQDMYDALYSLTEYNYHDLMQAADDRNTGKDDGKLQMAFMNVVGRIFRTVDKSNGGMLDALSSWVRTDDGKGVDIKKLIAMMPMSNPSVFAKITGNIASVATKGGIKVQLPGTRDVLNPSDGFIRLYGGKVTAFDDWRKGNPLLQDDGGEIKEQQKSFDSMQKGMKVVAVPDITLGTSYFITRNGVLTDLDGNSTDSSCLVETPDDYWKVKKLRNVSLTEDVRKGRDLACSGYTFDTMSGKHCCLWDIDGVRRAYDVSVDMYKDDYDNGAVNDAYIADNFGIGSGQVDLSDYDSFKSSVKNAMLQKAFNAIGSGDSARIFINGQEEIVDKKSVICHPFEFVATENYARQFGIDDDDKLSDIQNDKYFFLRKAVSKLSMDTSSGNDYDLRLTTPSGNDYHILYDDGRKTSLHEKNVEWDIQGDKAWRCDVNHNHLYRVPVKDGNVNAHILEDGDGNEIIRTPDIAFMLNTLHYDTAMPVEGMTVSKLIDLLTQIGSALMRIATGGSTEALEGRLSEVVKNLNGAVSSRDKEMDMMTKELEKGTPDLTKFSSPLMRQMIASAMEKRTSFNRSLKFIASRTPAQCYQSFMPMTLVGFDKSGRNSAYVSRWQYWLQGSDLDIDKVNILGYMFDNGKYIKHSPFADISSDENMKASDSIPFPTRRTLGQTDALNRRAYDYIDRPVVTDVIPDETVISMDGNPDRAVTLSSLQGHTAVHYILDVPDHIDPLDRYILKRHALSLIPDGSIIDEPQDFSDTDVQDDGTRGDYDYTGDLKEFNAAIGPKIFFSDGNSTRMLPPDPDNIRMKAIAIRAYNGLGSIPSGSDDGWLQPMTRMVNSHNGYLDRKYVDGASAAINYLSAKVFHAAQDPVNILQSMTSVDVPTKDMKKITNGSQLASQAKFFDLGSVSTKIRQQVLTLSGKQDTSIVASALKAFEAMSWSFYKTINYGSEEEQAKFLFDAKVDGKQVSLIANSIARNSSTVKAATLKKTLFEVDNTKDAFILYSVLLLLSTDNAKDPALGGGPEMIGLYTAGLSMGMDIQSLNDIMTSPAGMAVADLQKGNFITGAKGTFGIGGAVKAILSGPSAGDMTLGENGAEALKNILGAYGEKDLDKITPYNVMGRMRHGFSHPQIQRASDIVDRFRDTVYGNNDDGDAYIPPVEKIVSTLMRNNLRWISRNRKDMEALRASNEQKAASGETVRKSDLKKVASYDARVTEYDQQQDVLSSLRDKGTVPDMTGGFYDDARNMQDYYDMARTRDYKKSHEDIQNMDPVARKQMFMENKDEMDKNRNFIEKSQSYLNLLDKIFSRKSLVVGYDSILHNPLYVIRDLNYQNSEMGRVRSMLSINQGIPNDYSSQLAFVRSFERFIPDRMQELDSETRKATAGSDEMKALNEYNASAEVPENTVSFSMFFSDPEYRKLATDAYGKIKYTTNVYKVITDNNHYFGYLKLFSSIYTGMKDTSVVYRSLDEISRDIISGDMNVRKKTDINKLLRRSIDYVYKKMNNEFLFSKSIQVYIPDIKNPDDHIGDDTQYSTIQLGTRDGNERFKSFMDNVYIPSLKELSSNDVLMMNIEKFPNNNTDSGNTEQDWGISFDTMSNNPSEVQRYEDVKMVYSALPQVNYMKTGYMPKDMIFLYSLVTYNQKPGKHNFSDIITDVVADRSDDLINGYNLYISDMDKRAPDIIDTKSDQGKDEIERYLSPVTSVWAVTHGQARAPYVRVQDPESKKLVLLKKKDRIRQAQSQDTDEVMEDAIEEQYDMENDGAYDDEGIDDDVDEMEDYPQKRSFDRDIAASGYSFTGNRNGSVYLPGVSFTFQ